MSSGKHAFVVMDYIVFSMTVLISVSIGIYFAFAGSGQKTTLKYFLGGRNMHFLPVAMSLVVTFQSSIMMLGFPAEVYYHGFMISLFNVGQCAAILLATRIIVPLMYPLGITSVFQYLQMRFDTNAVRLLTVTIVIVSQLCYMGVVLFGPAIAFQSVTSFPVWASVLCIATASVIYTSIGGIKAVIWTDVFQCAIIIIGLIAILIKGTLDSGGADNVLTANYDSGRLDMLDFNPDPTIRHTFWTVTLGSFFGTFPLTLSQSTVQRFNATPKIKDAKRVLYIAGPLFVCLQVMSMSVGLVCFAYYFTKSCDPLRARQISNPNQIVPYMIVEIFRDYQGLSGLFISSLFSAALSTLSSILAGLSANTCEDLIKPYFKLTDKTLTLVAKVAVVVYGALGVMVAFAITKVQGSLTQILFSLMGAVNGPPVGIFFLAMFYPRATTKGVFIGGVVGFAFSFWISAGFNFSQTLPKTPPLPLAPIDGCPSPGVLNDTTLNTTLSFINYGFNTSTINYEAFGNDTTISTVASKAVNAAAPIASGLDKLYSISYAYFSVLGTFTTIIVGFIASVITHRASDKPVDAMYVLPMFDQLCCCLPTALRQRLHCGVDYGDRTNDRIQMNATNQPPNVNEGTVT